MVNITRVVLLILLLGALSVVADTASGVSVRIGSRQSSNVRYAGVGELHDLLILPWVDEELSKHGLSFSRPKCATGTKLADRYEDGNLYCGTIKLVGGSVAVVFALQKYQRNASLPNKLLNKLCNASSDDMKSRAFVDDLARLAGPAFNAVEIGTATVGGLNAFWSTTKMERRVGSEVVYRGLQRVYLIPLADGKTLMSASFVLGVFGAEDIPDADFGSFVPVGEKFIKSIKIKKQPKCKFW